MIGLSKNVGGPRQEPGPKVESDGKFVYYNIQLQT